MVEERSANPESPLRDSGRLIRLASVLLQNGKKDVALELLWFVASEGPADARSWDSLADAFALAGDTQGAANASNKAIQLADPEHDQLIIDASKARLGKLK